MEMGSILQFFENKSILVTGATGFLAKIFVEKILRVQPNVKKLYLLLRPTDESSATQRFHDEVLGKELFRVLKEKMGVNLHSFISEKVAPVAGDICCEDLGVKDAELKEQMQRQLDVVVNLAATTNFDERYDVALSINTLGAKHVLSFAKSCNSIKVFIHVSTAYVSGERGGLILEEPYRIGEALNGAPGLDVYEEKALVDERLRELRAQNWCEKAVTRAMKDFGIQRSKKYGWPNTYVFTKAMAEMLVGQLKENLPLVILRPTIVTSTYKEPFPGWVEGVRTIDSLIVGYAKGKLTFFLADLNGIADLIPGDMVVNSIIVAIVAHANQPSETIYHVGSSVRNPITLANVHDYTFEYFNKNPWIDRDGKAVKTGRVRIMSNMASFRSYMTIRYLLLLKGLELANTAFCHFFQQSCTDLRRKMNFVMRLVEIYEPYLFFKGIFDDMNTEKLRIAATKWEAEADVFYFDPKCIEWKKYFMAAHIPGIVKYVLK